MRISIVSALVLLLAVLSIPANADGCFVPPPVIHQSDLTEPSQKALIICDGKTEHMTLRVGYKGDAANFAWLVPTPSKPEVSRGDNYVFHRLQEDTTSDLRYWLSADEWVVMGFFAPSMMYSRGPGNLEPNKSKVDVLDMKQVGVYDIAVLHAENADDLLKWLHTNGYQITPKLAPVLDDYIRRGWVFTAMRVSPGRLRETSGQMKAGVLKSLMFSFPSAKPIYPLKISSLNKGKTDIVLYVLARDRVEEPLMKTVCSLPEYQVYTYDPLLDNLSQLRQLTKVAATLKPKQMDHDLVFERASWHEIPVPQAYPPFLENLGALVLLTARFMTDMPFSWIFLIVISSVTFRSRRQESSAGVGFLLIVIGLTRFTWWIFVQWANELHNPSWGLLPILLVTGALTACGLLYIVDKVRYMGLSRWVTAGIFYIIMALIAVIVYGTGEPDYRRPIFQMTGILTAATIGFAAYKLFQKRRSRSISATS